MEVLIFGILRYQKSQQGKLLKNGINLEDRRPFRVPCLLYTAWKRRLSKVFLYANAKGVFVV